MIVSRKIAEHPPSLDEHPTFTTSPQTVRQFCAMDVGVPAVLFHSMRAKLERLAAGLVAVVTKPRSFPLAQAGDGEQVEIVAVHGGGAIHRRLGGLGLTPGKRVTVVARQLGGPILVAIGASRVAIGFGMALKVQVVPTHAGDMAE